MRNGDHLKLANKEKSQSRIFVAKKNTEEFFFSERKKYFIFSVALYKILFIERTRGGVVLRSLGN